VAGERDELAQPLAHDQLLAVGVQVARAHGGAEVAHRARAVAAEPRAGEGIRGDVRREDAHGRALGAERLARQQREAVGLLARCARRGPHAHVRVPTGVGAREQERPVDARQLPVVAQERRLLDGDFLDQPREQPRAAARIGQAARERRRVGAGFDPVERALEEGMLMADEPDAGLALHEVGELVERARHAPAAAWRSSRRRSPIRLGPRMSSAPRSAAALGMPNTAELASS
jgi:hypothetical protein